MNNLYKPHSKNSPFEILNTINTQNKAIKYYLFSLSVLCVLLILALVYVAKKPPLIVRIDKLGHTEVQKDYTVDARISTAENIENFTKVFLDNYIALSSQYVRSQYLRSLNMMTEAYAKKHLEIMQKDNTIRKIELEGIFNKLEITKPKIEIVGDHIYVNVMGLLHTRLEDKLNQIPKTKAFKADLMLVKHAVTPEKPYGLLLKDIRVIPDQNEENIQNNISEVVK
jgi:hypothetical protein